LQYDVNHSQSVQQLTDRFLTYENPTSGISIEYPPQCSLSEAGRDVTFQSPVQNTSDAFQENLLVRVYTN